MCTCDCFVAYGFNAPQKIRVRQQIETEQLQQQRELDRESSRRAFSFYMQDAVKMTLESCAKEQMGSKIGPAGIQSMALTNAALAVAKGFDPSRNKAFVADMAKAIGKPTTKENLPAPIEIDGRLMPKGDCI